MSIPTLGGGERFLGDLDYVQSLVDCFLEGFPKSLHYINGCYGTWDAKNGFVLLTKFKMDPAGFISSKKFLLKGNLWDLLFLDSRKARIFVQENQQYYPMRFKHFFDSEHVQIR